MAYQTAANILVALRRESTTGTAAGATASLASVLRVIDSEGLTLTRAPIETAEKRDDGYVGMGRRLGGKSVTGTYNTELTVGGATDILFEAIMRSTWATAVTVGFATMTTVAIGTQTITAAAGDWVGAQGIRVGDVFTLSGTTVSGNNNTRAQVLAVTSLVITVATGAFTTLAATATGTLTKISKLISATTPTRYSHTVEQYDQDIDLSEVFLGCRLVGLRLSGRPGEMAKVQYTFLGMDRTALATGTSPYFTTPVVTTGLSLLADDSSIRYGASPVATFTGFDLDFAITAKGEPVIGSLVPPDIFDNNCRVTGTITGIRQDFSNLTLYDAETEFSVSMLFQDAEAAPKGCIGLYLPRCKLSGLSAPVGGGDGAKIETLTLMVAPKVAATGYDGTVAVICSSATH